MGDLLHDLTIWLDGLSPAWAYAGIFLVAYAENVLPPVPGDMAVAFGGYLAGVGKLHFALVAGVAALGSVAGFMTMYFIGYTVGDAVLRSRWFRWIPPERMDAARRRLDRWGYGLVAANRFLAGLRGVIGLAVGMARMDAWRTAAVSALSAIVWILLIVWAGYALGDRWEDIGYWLRGYGQAVLLFLGLALLAVGVRRYARKRKRSARKSAENAKSKPR